MTTCVGKIKTTRYHTNRYQTLTCYFVGILANCVDTTSLVLGSPIPARSNERIRAARHVPVFGYSSFLGTNRPRKDRQAYITHATATLTFVSGIYLFVAAYLGLSLGIHSTGANNPMHSSTGGMRMRQTVKNRQFAATCNEISAIRNQTKINDLYHASPRRFVLIPT